MLDGKMNKNSMTLWEGINLQSKGKFINKLRISSQKGIPVRKTQQVSKKCRNITEEKYYM